jgi:hypothetical protein
VKRGISFGWASAALAGSALVAAGSALGLVLHFRARVRDEEGRAETRMRDLGALAERDAPFGDDRVAALREEIARFELGLGDGSALERLSGGLGPRWSLGEVQASRRGNYVLRRATCSLARPELSDWPAILGAVRSAEEIPGVRVAGIEIRSSGDNERRSLDVVRITCEVEARGTPLKGNP